MSILLCVKHQRYTVVTLRIQKEVKII